MEIELSLDQLRRLLDLVYIGNWIINYPKEDKRIREYDEVESLMFGYAAAGGMKDLAERLNGEVVPSRAYVDGGIHMAIDAYHNYSFFEILAEELALRDMQQEQIDESNTEELDRRVDGYLNEFDRFGADHVQVEGDPIVN